MPTLEQISPKYRQYKKDKDALENGFNGRKDRASARAKSAVPSTVNAAANTVKGVANRQKASEFLNSPAGQKVQQFYNAFTSEKKTSSEAKPAETKKKKDPNRFKAISERANAKLTDEQKANIEKNNNRIYWQNKERMNNSGSYKAMMQSRTKGAMQKASEKNLSKRERIDEIKSEKKSNAYKAYDKAFGNRKGR